MSRQRRPYIAALILVLMGIWVSGAAEGALRGIRAGEQRAGARLVVDLDAPVPYFLRQESLRVHLMLGDGLRGPLEGTLPFPARSYRAQGTSGHTEVVVELASAAVTVKAFTLQSPDRVVVDLLPRGGAPRTSAAPWALPPLPTLPPVPSSENPRFDAELFPMAVAETNNAAAPRLQGSASPRERVQSLFSGDVVLRRRFVSQPFPFFVPAGDRVLAGARAELRWRASSLLNGGRSSLTVTLDGVPLASRKVDKNPEEGELWVVPLPSDRLTPGRHVLDVAAFLATSSDACADLENPALWCRLESPGLVRWPFAPSVPQHPRSVPLFFRTARGTSPDLFPTLVVPAEASPDEVAVGVHFLLGALREPHLAPPLWIRRLGASEDLSPPGELQAFVGLWPRWPAAVLRRFAVPSQKPKSLVTLAPAPGGSWSFFAGAASLEELRQHLENLGCSTPEVVGDPLNPPPSRPDGTLFFRDLVGSDLVFRGAGPQEDALVVTFPAAWDLEPSGELLVRFRHAPGLDGQRSALTVERDGVPLAGVPLTEENALGGSLRVPLDLSTVRGHRFSLGIRARLDLGTADCSGRLGERAWLVVDRGSWVRLPHRTTSPDLAFENLPEAWGPGPLTLLLPSRASGPVLTLAARLLQLWQSRGTLPEVRWLPLETASAGNGPTVVLGDRETLARRGLLPALSEDFPGASGPGALSEDCLLRLDLGRAPQGPLLAVWWHGSFPEEVLRRGRWEEDLRGVRAALLREGPLRTLGSSTLFQDQAPLDTPGLLALLGHRLEGDRFLVGLFALAGAVVAGAVVLLILRLRRS